MSNFIKHLKGGDLRSIANVDKVLLLIHTQAEFDELFSLLYSTERLIVMRTADAIEKITKQDPQYLKGHNQDIINLINKSVDKELKWHLAQISSRLDLTAQELKTVCSKLTQWAKDKKESRIVRVNSIQALFEIAKGKEMLKKDFALIIKEIESENIPSLNARLKKLKM